MAKDKNRRRVKLGLLGSGTVGEAVQDLVFKGLKGRPGRDLELEIVKIYTREPQGKRWYAARPELFTSDAEEVIDHPEAEIIVEALGFQGEEQLPVYKDYIIRAFSKGKSVVTSDKAVLASFGREIWAAAEKHGRDLRFEACVGGGIPIIRSLTESFAAEEPELIYGIVNGTCNYILSEMEKSGKSYGVALREAQALGYAETNPKSDTSGMDAEAKLILLAAVTFGIHVKPGLIWRKGIEEIDALDFLYAGRKGSYTIKQLAVARSDGDAVEGFVSPVLLPRGHLLAAVNGPTNAIFFKGKRSKGKEDGSYVFVGPGAGGGPTAVAIMGDVHDLARGGRRACAPRSLVAPGALALQPADQIAGSFYVRFVVRDRPGIVGDICQTFGKIGINISEVWQLTHSREELRDLAQSCNIKEKAAQLLPFVITLEQATAGQVRSALGSIGRKDYLLADPVWFPIWRN